MFRNFLKFATYSSLVVNIASDKLHVFEFQNGVLGVNIELNVFKRYLIINILKNKFYKYNISF